MSDLLFSYANAFLVSGRPSSGGSFGSDQPSAAARDYQAFGAPCPTTRHRRHSRLISVPHWRQSRRQPLNRVHFSIEHVRIAKSCSLFGQDQVVIPLLSRQNSSNRSRTEFVFCQGSTSDPKRSAVIVGGGPSGLAAALMLARRGWTDITVLERQPTIDFASPDKGFVYRIDSRGRKFTDAVGLPLEEAGVPADSVTFTVCKPDGTRTTTNFAFGPPAALTPYWLSRPSFMLLLERAIESNWSAHVQIRCDVQMVRLERAPLHVVARARGTGETLDFYPDLVIGCDGVRSRVRAALQEWAAADEISSPSSGPSRFSMEEFPSPSTGLRYKCFSVPLTFPTAAGGSQPADPDASYVFPSAVTDPSKRLRLGVLPTRGGTSASANRRPVNIIAYPDHYVWTLRDAAEFRAFLVRSFPQLPIDDLVSLDDARVFVESDGGRFVAPQFCNGMQYCLPLTSDPSERTTITAADQSPRAATVSAAGDWATVPSVTSDQSAAEASKTATRGEDARPVVAGASTNSKPADGSQSATVVAGASANSKPADGSQSATVVAGVSANSKPADESQSATVVAGASPNSKPAEEGRVGGVVLLGDAIHAFPPDLGQGVNSALEDVVELEAALSATSDDIARALPLFEERRLENARALARLMQFGAPWQYNQNPTRAQLWQLGLLVRIAFHKVMPQVFAAPCALRVQSGELSYAQILREDEETLQRILWVSGVVLAVLALVLFRFAFGSG